ncbi:hypothetical protein Tco_1383786 [Tanacetum coccineum]
MEEEEVSLVDGVFEGALGALGDESDAWVMRFWCHLELLIENEEDDEMVIVKARLKGVKKQKETVKSVNQMASPLN